MANLNHILKNANVYSIEYSGIYSIKLSLSNELDIYKKFRDVKLEFVSGGIILNSKNEVFKLEDKIFNFFGCDIKHILISENYQLQILFSNEYKIVTRNVENENWDRNWVLNLLNGEEGYILSDGESVYYSDNIKDFIN